MPGCPFQSIGIFIIADHQLNLCILNRPGLHGINDGLQIGASSGYQHCQL